MNPDYQALSNALASLIPELGVPNANTARARKVAPYLGLSLPQKMAAEDMWNSIIVELERIKQERLQELKNLQLARHQRDECFLQYGALQTSRQREQEEEEAKLSEYLLELKKQTPFATAWSKKQYKQIPSRRELLDLIASLSKNKERFRDELKVRMGQLEKEKRQSEEWAGKYLRLSKEASSLGPERSQAAGAPARYLSPERVEALFLQSLESLHGASLKRPRDEPGSSK